MGKMRLDVLLVERGLAASRSLAQRLVMAGKVRVDGQVALKPAQEVAAGAVVAIDSGPRYVSRGGEKLAAALKAFEIDPFDRICADVGASTGGFTDCLLQGGARRVYAIDVGKGILHWKLRQDKRVVVMEATNARQVMHLPEPVSLVTIDAAFISLKLLLPVVYNWLDPPPKTAEEALPAAHALALVKPQFEAGRAEARRGAGVIRDPAVHRQVLEEVLAFAEAQGYTPRGLIRSPLLGPKGNAEFLAWLERPRPGGIPGTSDLQKLIADLFTD
jgi:23S rRNA (cytidine1920-2'-O)/16S rRNA (cytidine1409-2'-O)-methyltransferase